MYEKIKKQMNSKIEHHLFFKRKYKSAVHKFARWKQADVALNRLGYPFLPSPALLAPACLNHACRSLPGWPKLACNLHGLCQLGWPLSAYPWMVDAYLADCLMFECCPAELLWLDAVRLIPAWLSWDGLACVVGGGGRYLYMVLEDRQMIRPIDLFE